MGKNITELLVDRIAKNGYIKASEKKNAMNSVTTAEFPVKNFNILKVRDSLYGLGSIIEENKPEMYYLTSVKTGFLGLAAVLVITRLDGDTVSAAAYAKGPGTQKTKDEALAKIKQRLDWASQPKG